MSRVLTLALLAFVVLAVAGVAAAGSRGNPEVIDARADGVDSTTGDPVTAPDADILAAWFEETSSSLRVHVRVADLTPPAGARYTNWHVWWTYGGETYRVFGDRSASGSTAELHTVHTVSSADESAADDVVRIAFDDVRDEVVWTFPKSFDFRPSAANPAGRRATFDDGDTLGQPYAWASTGTSAVVAAATRVDDTAPGRDFTLGASLTSNPHVFLDPGARVLRVASGGVATIPLGAFSLSPLDLGTTLVASASRDDWHIEETTRALALDAKGKASLSLKVRVPHFAAPGDACLVTVSGAAFPVTVMLVVDDVTGTAAKAAEAAMQAPPLTTERVLRQNTFHLQGNTSTGATGDGRPVVPGRLVETAPAGTQPDGVVLRFGQTTVAPAGQWIAPAFASATNLTGQVRVDAWARWNGVSNVRLRALVGPAPLPLDWDGRTPLPGVLVLEPTGSGTGTGGQLGAATATTDKVTFGAGDRLAVALYVEANGNGQVLIQHFSKATPSRLFVNLEEPALARPVPGVVPSTGEAAFRGAFAPPFGAAGLDDVTATIQGPNAPVPLRVAAVPVDVRHGAAVDAPATKALDTTPFSPFDAGLEHVHPFDVAATSRRVEVVLRGQSTGDRANENDLDLLVRRDGVAVRASRGDGAAETVVLGPELLARYGAGRYEAVVRLDRAASSTATSVDYDVDVIEHTSVVQKGARFDAAALWSFDGKPLGDYTLRVARGGAIPEAVLAVYRLTDVGPTFAPTADFTYAPLLPVSGQLVNFTDLSVDLDGRLARWTWRFGDGATSTERNPQHAFPRPGAYVVNLTVADDFNATAIGVSRVVDVGNAPPIAAFTTDPLVGTAGDVVRFTDRSFDPDGNISDRAWSFGDGTGHSDKVVEHVYNAPGTYNVSLTVFDEPRSLLAGSRVVRAFVVVEAGAAPSGRPTADFEAPLNPVEGRPARFVDASFWEEGILERRWDFGDGGFSSESDPLHTFGAAGEYQVTLTVFPPGRSDLTASLTRTVRVAATSGISASFTMTPAMPATSDVVTFTDTTTVLRGAVTRHWDFGDGSIHGCDRAGPRPGCGATAAGPTATHVFARAGTFTVRLTVSDPDGAKATSERSVVVTRAALVAAPAPESPRGGSLFHYKADYDKGVEHKEDYAATWRDDELMGLLKADADYLAAGGAYVLGTATRAPRDVSWSGGGATLTSPAGATTTALGAEVAQTAGSARARALAPASAAIGSRPVDLSALDAPPAVQDDLADGLFRVETVLEGGGIQVRRSTTILDGALHADVRTHMQGDASQPMRLVTESALRAPGGSWIATWDGDAVRTFPVAGAEDLTYDLGGYANRWFAVFDPATREVAGVVVSGDVTGITLLRRGDDIVVRADHVGLGEVLAAEYVVAYEVAESDATRYAGVMEIARQDNEEIGLAVLGDGRAAAVAWAGGRATLGVSATRGLEAWWDRVNGLPATWTIELEAPSRDDGKAMRIVLPGTVVRDGGVQVALDGVTLSSLAYDALADDGTLVLVVPIEHFSRHEIAVRAVVPGLPQPFLWLGLAFGVVVGGGALFTFGEVRSRAVRSVVSEAPAEALLTGVRSASVARALGEFDSPAAQELKAALLRKLTEGQAATERARYTRCSNCASPVRFGAGESTTACPRCGAENVLRSGGET